MARIKPGKRGKVDGPKKSSPAKKPLGNSSTVPGSKGKFMKGKKTAKRSGTS